MGRISVKKGVVFAFVAIILSTAMLVGCAPQVTEGGDLGESPEISVSLESWSMESNCQVCHTEELGTLSAVLCATEGSATCINCHDDEDGLTKAHSESESTVPEVKKLKVSEVSSEACLGCHGGDLSTFVEETSDVTSLVDTEGNEANPHLAMVAEHHADAGIQCSGCHNPHSEKAITVLASKTCLGCHHAGAYECYTCHE